MVEIAALFGIAAMLGAVLLTVLDSAPSAAQSPTPAATAITPAVSTVSPSRVVVSPQANVAESTTEPLSSLGGGGDGSSGVKTGVIAGIAAAAAVIFAGIAYRLARGRPRAG